MADQPSSIKSRIAALNIEQVHAPAPSSRAPYTYEQATNAKKKPPPPPPSQRPPVQPRIQSVNNPPVNVPTSERHVGNQPAAAKPDLPKRSPALPPRPPPRSNSKAPPPLPVRQPSEPLLRRRESVESIATVSSGISSLSLGSARTSISNSTPNGGQQYRIRAPEYDPTKLPPLPKKAPEDPKQTNSILKAMGSTAKATTAPRSLPPQLPSRPALPTRPESKIKQNDQPEPKRVLPPPSRPSALSFGMNKSTEIPPPTPASRPSSTPTGDAGVPPPIPLASRPNLDAIMASKPKPGAQGNCLVCRDFSGPDMHAARPQFMRNNLASSDVGWLATQLTAPFPSATDKARAIFVWLHHNVDYDTHSFFGGNISPSTPEKTLTSGLAVCEGYAGLFAALAVKAGLEAIVVGGDGKGYGHSPLKPGDPIPPFSSNHAWNAVRIDNGEWKLIDSCWGAGSLGCSGTYERHFTASEFSRSNNEFGYTHYPTDPSHLFRTDGHFYTWEEYKMDDMGERLQIYGDPGDHGVGKRTFQPPMKHIKVHDSQEPVVRFQFATACPHWDHEKHGKGKPYVMTLNVGGRDGRNSQHLPLNTDGKIWWLDVNRIELGAPGQKVNVCAITEVDGRDARGLSVAQYKSKKGRCAMKWSYLCMWELV